MEKNIEVVINNCFGGFSLSFEGVKKYAELAGIEAFAYVEADRSSTDYDNRKYKLIETYDERHFIIHWLTKNIGNLVTSEQLNKSDCWLHDRDIPRDDVNLIKTVRLLKNKANGSCASLKIVKIPADMKWNIHDYDGNEHVAEDHITFH